MYSVCGICLLHVHGIFENQRRNMHYLYMYMIVQYLCSK